MEEEILPGSRLVWVVLFEVFVKFPLVGKVALNSMNIITARVVPKINSSPRLPFQVRPPIFRSFEKFEAIRSLSD